MFKTNYLHKLSKELHSCSHMIITTLALNSYLQYSCVCLDHKFYNNNNNMYPSRQINWYCALTQTSQQSDVKYKNLV